MTEFEKWFKKNKPYEVYSCMNMAEKAWRAALKWAKAMHDVSSEPRFSLNILKELENDRQTPIN